MAKRQDDLPLGADPLTESQAKKLLALVDVVRDPLHGDIRLTALERCIVDSPEFQRLRNINQLAMTYIAYPGAVHTRFLHSLGVLHVCSTMINTCNENGGTYGELAAPNHPVPLRLTPYTMVLARLCALMHDMAHVPFGHSFEKEGGIFTADEWKDPVRRESYLLGPDTKLAVRLRSFFKSQSLPETAADGLREEIKQILMAPRNDVTKLRYPFVHDLVGNTICADLIDYVQRDMFFCGLTETFGKRFLNYLAVVPVIEGDPERVRGQERPTFAPVTGERETVFPLTSRNARSVMCRVVLLSYRYNERAEPVVKYDVFEEAIDLVRRRLTVAEKLYFHRTKMVASAMLISAAYDAKLDAAKIWNLTDDEVLRLLSRSEPPRAAALGRKLLDRTLFKPIYRFSYRHEDESDQESTYSRAYKKYQVPAERERLAKRLEEVIGLIVGDSATAVGSVCISCPDRDMNLKAFDMLVLKRPTDPGITRLHDSNYPPTRQAIDAILTAHRYLFRFEISVDPDVVRPDPRGDLAKRIAGAIQQAVGPINELPGFEHVPGLDLDAWKHELRVSGAIAVAGCADTITHADREALLGVEHRELTEMALVDAVKEFLRAKKYEVK